MVSDWATLALQDCAAAECGLGACLVVALGFPAAAALPRVVVAGADLRADQLRPRWPEG